MRLLQLEADDDFSLAEFHGTSIPPYAVLSHTWAEDSHEVPFKDIVKRKGKGRGKPGYNKLRFCAQQAAHDELKYFWVDTCCIDKSSSAELSEAINSMFSWYRDANKCYVYLADVSIRPREMNIGLVRINDTDWTTAFRQSKWFTRGWTLQELLAPRCVEFFSKEGERRGDKQTLIQDIYQATAISLQALKEDSLSLSSFSIGERMSWASKRETKREQDAAYSLLGLFDLHMPLIYGEGRKKALARLYREIDNVSAYGDVHSTGVRSPPNHAQIEVRLGGLVGLVDDKDSNPLKRIASESLEVSHTDVRRRSQQRRGVKLDERLSVDGHNEDQLEEMRMWWEECVARNVDLPEGYQKVAVLISLS